MTPRNYHPIYNLSSQTGQTVLMAAVAVLVVTAVVVFWLIAL